MTVIVVDRDIFQLRRMKRELLKIVPNALYLVRFDPATSPGEAAAELSESLSRREVTAIVSDVESTIAGASFSQNTIAAILSAFALAITAISMVIIYFRISNSIEQNVVNIGTLKALGCTSRQVRLAMTLEFGAAAAAAILCGVVLAYPILLIIEEEMRPATNLVWEISLLPGPFLITLGVILGTVLLVAFFSTARIKPLDPFIALQFGLDSEERRVNRLPLEFGRGPLTWMLAWKDALSGTRQNVMLSVVMISVALLLLLIISFLVFSLFYYRADEAALCSMQSDEAVSVTKITYGWLFDGPSEDAALIFYPGAKVEETTYAPLLHLLAAQGMDVCLVRAPLHFAFFAPNAARAVQKTHNYTDWYVGGHSLGGVVAAWVAADHPEDYSGTILLASYPVRKLPNTQTEILLVGSEDQVISWPHMESGRAYASEHYLEYILEGGNHAQFGSYGVQRGDGTATITAEEQVRETVSFIIEILYSK